jgi:pyruvate/2-oxoglutarate dehydrogenase complex dihydrolipoamide dehydrogenase (E3) component
MKHYRIVVLGGGAAGIVTAMGAAGMGISVALIESKRIGGECSWTGCVPSKALLAAAKEVHRIRHAAKWGVAVGAGLDVSGVPAKVRELTQRTADRSQTVKQLKTAGVELYFGEPRFVSKNEVEVDGVLLRGEDIVIATGSSPIRPENIGLETVPYVTNQEIFAMEKIPNSFGVIGGGPIGIEMAQAFGRLGSAVTVFQSEAQILPHDDKELADALTEILRQEGITIHLATRVKKVEKLDGKIWITAEDATGSLSVAEVDALLVSAGRKANIEGLGLAEIGVEHTAAGIKVDKHLQTTVPRIWACGDCNGQYRFSHIAEVEARTVLQNILLPINQEPDYAGIPWGTFTDPELAHLGLTETEAESQGIQYRVYRQPFSLVDRAVVEQEDAGLIKLIAKPNGQLLGAHILGAGASDLLNELIVARHAGVGLKTLSSLPHVYPSWGYGIQRAIDHWLIEVSKRWYAQFVLKALKKLSG